jgi:hypothetical protein
MENYTYIFINNTLNSYKQTCFSIGKYYISDLNLMEYMMLKDFYNWMLIAIGIIFICDYLLQITNMLKINTTIKNIPKQILTIPFLKWKRKPIKLNLKLFNKEENIFLWFKKMSYYSMEFKTYGTLGILLVLRAKGLII